MGLRSYYFPGNIIDLIFSVFRKASVFLDEWIFDRSCKIIKFLCFTIFNAFFFSSLQYRSLFIIWFGFKNSSPLMKFFCLKKNTTASHDDKTLTFTPVCFFIQIKKYMKQYYMYKNIQELRYQKGIVMNIVWTLICTQWLKIANVNF